MPAAAVPSRTPATSGMSGKLEGASGETDAMARPPRRSSGRNRRPCSTTEHDHLEWRRILLRLLGGRRRRGRLIEPLDLGVGAQLAHELDLRLAHRVILDL